MSSIIFELRDVHYSYLGKFSALSGINLSVSAGEKISVIGANGTGKSTLLALLDALIFPDKGEIKAFGCTVDESLLNDREFSTYFRKKVGFVFQNPDVALFCPTVREDIVFGPLQLGVPHDEVKKRLSSLAKLFDIVHLLDRAPHQLSIGEKRKAAFASVLAIDPDVILLDEPTAGLDPLTSRHIVDLILDANSKGKTIITATHDLHVVSEISDTIYVFGKGKNIVKHGTPEIILTDNELLSANNLLHIHSHKHKDKTHAHSHTGFGHHSGQ
jgi:cobalt/nickel transport system ATP-binding protein